MYTGNAERGDIVVFYPGATGSADLARSFYNSRNGLENTAEWRLAGSARIHPITQLSHGCTSVEDLYGRLRHMCNEMSENQERTTLVIMCVGRDNSSRVIRNFIARALPDDLHKWVLKVVLLPERADSANDFQRVAAVLETGYCEVRILDPITQIPRVGVKPISHAERTLRLGCLGRICAGTAVCIEPLGGLTARPHREIEAEDLVTLVLRTRKQGVLLENIAEALGLARDSVIGAITHLQNIGCLSSRGEIIDYGKRISAVVGLSPDYALLFLEIAGGDEAHAVAFLVLLYAIVIPRLVDPEAARDDAEEFIDKIRGDHAPNDDEIACAGICAFKVDSGIMIPTLRPDGTCIRATSVCLECLEEGLRYYLRKFYPDGETVARLGEYTAIESLTLASQIVISKGNVTPFAASVARFVDHRTCGVLINHWVHVKVGIVLSYRGFFSRCPEHPAVPLIVNPNANEKEMRCECVTPECKLGMHAFCEDWHLKNACLNAKIFKDIRRCPRCKHGVAFIGGCYCMTCICKQIFCWHCGKGFRDTDSAHDHLNAEHGGVFSETQLIFEDSKIEVEDVENVKDPYRHLRYVEYQMKEIRLTTSS
ncbi:hypothetical protein GMRT_12096 [Giardia muris]|uniref:C2H2-type domain-containing protein n=1 Tax=Giardia muris TaxID=5742 RepID=A0A4Z1SZS4_GIAMU|nr:hypothetical protein GMRT_12096 [Giardia muris]|eukprot:TNJ28958.1 hypothetical protein GMRT_12096 [Giardia muris]